jgi:hypothetical protein
MVSLPLTRLRSAPTCRSLEVCDNLSDADSETVEEAIDRLTILLQQVIDKDVMADTEWEQMQVQIALDDSDYMTDQNLLDEAAIKDFRQVKMTRDCSNCSSTALALDHALMTLEDLKSQAVTDISTDYLDLAVEEAELKYFIELLGQAVQASQGVASQQLFYLGGKHLKISINRPSLTQAGLTLTQEMAVKSPSKLHALMQKSFYKHDTQVYGGDANCLDGVLTTLDAMKENLVLQIEEAKAVKSSYARVKQRCSLTSNLQTEDGLQRRRLQDLSSLWPRQPSKQTMAPHYNSANTQPTQRDILELELRNLEANYSDKLNTGDISQSARVATRISRVKTELQKLRSEEAIKTARQNSLRRGGRSNSISTSSSQVIATPDDLQHSFDGTNELLSRIPYTKADTSASLSKSSSEDYAPCKVSSLTLQLKEFNKERQEFEEHRVTKETELAVLKQKLAAERVQLETDKKSLETLRYQLELQSVCARRVDKHYKIQRLCSSFLASLARLKA